MAHVIHNDRENHILLYQHYAHLGGKGYLQIFQCQQRPFYHFLVGVWLEQKCPTKQPETTAMTKTVTADQKGINMMKITTHGNQI